MIELHGITKRYGAVLANDAVDLDVAPGEIVGLLGQNGSGKSTLMKSVFGMVAPDSGSIHFGRQLLTGHTPSAAMAAGIGMVHQHFMLFDGMTVTENVLLGLPGGGIVRLGDRVGVMAGGRLVDVMPRSQADAGRLGLLMAGSATHDRRRAVGA